MADGVWAGAPCNLWGRATPSHVMFAKRLSHLCRILWCATYIRDAMGVTAVREWYIIFLASMNTLTDGSTECMRVHGLKYHLACLVWLWRPILVLPAHPKTHHTPRTFSHPLPHAANVERDVHNEVNRNSVMASVYSVHIKQICSTIYQYSHLNGQSH